jgi:hypothetical protein
MSECSNILAGTLYLSELDLPGEDVLGVIVSQVDFRGTAKRPSLCDAIIRLQKVRYWEEISCMSQ